MTTRSNNWSVTHPTRISHPRPPIQLTDDAAAHGSEDPNLNQPPLGSRSPLPRRLNATRPSLLLLPGRPCRPVAGGRSDDHGRVRFDSVVQLILVPSRKDIDAALSQELWWNQEDYLQFRCDAFFPRLALLLLLLCLLFCFWFCCVPPVPSRTSAASGRHCFFCGVPRRHEHLAMPTVCSLKNMKGEPLRVFSGLDSCSNHGM